jgi:hypothetical protein
MSSVGSAVAGAGVAQFRIGSALSRAFQVYGAGAGRFFVLTLIPMAPLLILGLVAGPGGGGVGVRVSSGLLQFVLSSLAQATCLYGAYQIMRGRSFGVGDSLGVGLRRLGPVLWTLVLCDLLIGLGLLFLVIPGIIVGCALYVALPACMIELLGATHSLGRSRELTRGSRWPIFGLLLLVGVAGAVLGAGVGGVASWVGGWMLLTIAVFAVQVIAQSFGAVLCAVVYHDLRVAKEGVDTDTIASVFD